MRQLDWWEVIQPGDFAWFPGGSLATPCRVYMNIGITVDYAFWHYKAGDELVIFYRPDEN